MKAMVSHPTQPEIRIEAFQIAEICGGLVHPETAALVFCGATYDSRLVRPGHLFVALPGARTDGHRHLGAAVKAGAALLLVKNGHGADTHAKYRVPVVEVDDTLAALGKLAGWYRERFTIPFVAVTGSNGKTTTKELAATALSPAYRVFKTPGNLNSRIGLPVSLFDLGPQFSAAVCEMGMSTRGEIDALARMVRPQYGVITNIAPAHLETLETLEEVARAKFELLNHLAPGGVALLCADDPILVARARELGARALTFGIHSPADLCARDVRSVDEGTRFSIDSDLEVFLPLFGKHNVYNALAALLVAREMGVDMLPAVAALALFRPVDHRSRIARAGTLTVIDDAYNANPRAVEAALTALAEFPAPARRVAVLGDMLELGPEAARYHRQIGARIAELHIDLVVTVGTLARQIGSAACAEGFDGAQVLHFDSAVTCAADAGSWSRADDTILVKGSRGVALESVVTTLQNNYDPNEKEAS